MLAIMKTLMCLIVFEVFYLIASADQNSPRETVSSAIESDEPCLPIDDANINNAERSSGSQSQLTIGLCAIQRSTRKTLTKRRYDIIDLGYPARFHGWADVQGNGAVSDYCRLVGGNTTLRLACALGGTHGESELAYESAWAFDIGHKDTWYMRDEDGDGRDDYCRCLGNDPTKSKVVCTKAGEKGFYGSKLQGGASNTFTPTGPSDCKSRIVYPEFGRVYGFV